jgi:hypothetical protein
MVLTLNNNVVSILKKYISKNRIYPKKKKFRSLLIYFKSLVIFDLIKLDKDKSVLKKP